MANNIKGITVEIGGDTGPLNKALKDADSTSRGLQTELNKVNKLLKLDPTNTELLSQKQELLSKQVQNTKEKLDALRQAQEKVNKAHEANAQWEKEYSPLKVQIDDTREKLKKLTSQQETFAADLASGKITTAQYEKFQTELQNTTEKSKDLARQQRELEKQFTDGHISDKEYRDFQRTLIETESQLKNLEKQAVASNVTLSKISSTAEKVGSNAGKVASTMAPVSLAIGGVTAAAVKVGNEFESQMSRVKAISGATGDSFKALSDQALQLGQDTAYSATEAAQGMENLASAGFSTSEVMEAMPGMLDLAASSGEDLASSADIAASTLRGFGLSADQAGHVADVLAKNAADTNAAVADTGAAMKYIAPVAQNAGWSLESVTAAIGEMADAGIKGEQAGTTLRGALTSLMNPSKQQAEAMQAIGFSAYDANGKMKPLSQIISDLSEGTKDLSDEQRDGAIATIMGTNALSGMQVLLKNGSQNLDTLTASLEKSDGAAKEMAATMQDNTSSAIEQMGGALETAGIKIQQTLAPIITKIANYVGDLASKFSELSPEAQTFILVIAGMIAAIAPVAKIVQGASFLVGGATKAIGGISLAMKVASGAATATSAGISLLSKAILLLSGPVGIAIAVIAAVAVAFVVLWNKCDWFRNFWIGLWNNIKATVSSVVNALVIFFTVTIPQAWDGLAEFFTGIPAWWDALWAQVGQFFADCWNGIILFFTETIPAWIQAVIDWFNQLPYMIGLAIGEILADIVNFGVSAWNWVTVELPKIIQGIVDWFSQLPGKIWAFLVAVVTSIGTWGANLVQKAIIEIPKFISSVISFFQQIPGKIWAFFADVVLKVVTWATNLVTTAGVEIPKFVSSVMSFIGELPGKMLEVGDNIVKGIWDGINGAVDWLHDRISDFCSGIVDGFKKKLKIHSPSVLFADIIGKNLALGIGQGFTENMKAVVATMTAAIPTTWDTGIEIRTAMAAAYGGYSAPVSSGGHSSDANSAGTVTSGDVKVYQYFDGKTPTPAEHARQTRNGLRQVVKELRKK